MERSAIRSSVGVLDARADAEGRRVRSWYRPRDDAVAIALTPPAAVTSCNPAEPCTTVAQTCTTSPPYCCTQSLDWVEGRCVLVAA